MTELHIEPLCSIFDLLLGIGLIALGLCGFAIVITVEIYYFRRRKGEAAYDAARDGRKCQALPYAGRSIRSAWLQAVHYKLSSKGRPFQTWIRCMPYGRKRENPEAGFPVLAQIWERHSAH